MRSTSRVNRTSYTHRPSSPVGTEHVGQLSHGERDQSSHGVRDVYNQNNHCIDYRTHPFPPILIVATRFWGHPYVQWKAKTSQLQIDHENMVCLAHCSDSCTNAYCIVACVVPHLICTLLANCAHANTAHKHRNYPSHRKWSLCMVDQHVVTRHHMFWCIQSILSTVPTGPMLTCLLRHQL